MTKTTRGTETGLTKRLFEIQTGVTETLRSRSAISQVSQKVDSEDDGGYNANLVAKAKFLLTELHTPAQTLSHAVPLLIELTRELKTDPTEPRHALSVDAEAGREFADDCTKVTRLQTRRRYEGARNMSVS
jgi:hypothetical protein